MCLNCHYFVVSQCLIETPIAEAGLLLENLLFLEENLKFLPFTNAGKQDSLNLNSTSTKGKQNYPSLVW